MAGSRPQTITKKELIARISERTGQTKVVVKDVLQRFLDEIITELAQGNRLEFREFGVFEVRARGERLAQNPRTLVKVKVPEKRVVKFKVGRLMRAKVIDAAPPPRLAAAKKSAPGPASPPGANSSPAGSGSTPKPPASNSPF
jgi:integration host factor subunit beta